MQRFGLIGHPLAGSGSPALFERAYGGRLPYDLIEGEDFEASWARFLKDYQAINITAPFKELAFERVIPADETVRRIGAVNIAVKTEKGIIGYNSDCLGVRKLLEDKGFGKDAVAVVAGFGGAGKAAYAAAVSLGMDAVVCNRTAKPLGYGGFTRPLEELPILAAVADILIYTLPVATEGVSCPAVLEANYRSPGMQYAASSLYIPGTDWLLEQARTGYELMTGEAPLPIFCFYGKK